MYTDNSRQGWTQSTAFKKTFSMDVDIEFIGVWDTVSAVGLIGKQLPFTKSNTCVKYFRHAISLDERRAKFRQNTWNHLSEKEKGLGVQAGEMPKAGEMVQSPSIPKQEKDLENDLESEIDQDEMEQRFSKMCSDPNKETDILEVWFAGCHCGTLTFIHRHLLNTTLIFLIRGCRFRAERHSPQPGAYTITLDGKTVFPKEHWYQVPRGALAKRWT